MVFKTIRSLGSSLSGSSPARSRRALALWGARPLALAARSLSGGLARLLSQVSPSPPHSLHPACVCARSWGLGRSLSRPIARSLSWGLAFSFASGSAEHVQLVAVAEMEVDNCPFRRLTERMLQVIRGYEK